jgi:hypothetical protein
MPNPDGYNAFGGPMEREMPYGALAKLEGLSRLAGTASPSAAGARAPKRAQRRSQRKGKAAPSPMVPPTQPTVPYEQTLSTFWSELAAEPGASPLLIAIAESARG